MIINSNRSIANFMQASVSLPKLYVILQRVKIGISKYLQLCMKAGFSQIQSQICWSILFKHKMLYIVVSSWCESVHGEKNFITHLIANNCSSSCIGKLQPKTIHKNLNMKPSWLTWISTRQNTALGYNFNGWWNQVNVHLANSMM